MVSELPGLADRSTGLVTGDRQQSVWAGHQAKLESKRDR